MKQLLIRRRFVVGTVVATMLLSAAGQALTPEPKGGWRIVKIRGHQVHVRRGIPPQLTHANVIRHLNPGEVLLADRVGYGISSDGTGTSGVWLHVIDPSNGECGWVNADFVEPLGDTIEVKNNVQETREQTDPAASDHDTPPPQVKEVPTFLSIARKKYGADVQFAADVASVFAAMIAAMMMMMSLFGKGSSAVQRQLGSQVPINNEAAPADNGSTCHTAHFIYGVAGGVPYRIPKAKP
jgi:hypothetical protein